MSSSTDEAPPVWARMLGVKGFHIFVTLVEDYFADRRISVRLDRDEGVVRPSADVFTQSSVFGLQNIAQTCSQADRDQWRELIATHFNCIFTASDDQNALSVDVSNFDKIKDMLRARLYPLELLNQSVETVHRSGPEGTIEVIVLDLPTTVRTIARTEAKVWPLERETLFEVGRRNLTKGGLLKDTLVQAHPGVDLHLFAGDPFYAASHALILDQYMPVDLPNGALVAIPKRDVLLVHAIRNIGVTEAISSMLQAVIGMYADGPGSLSPHLYWYREGDLITLPYEIKGDKASLDFTPPGDFVELLQRLADSADLS